MTTRASGEQLRKPEERELENKKAELASLEVELVQHELDLATLRADLADFENQYLRRVGVLYAELDEIEARIAETKAYRRPNDTDAQESAARARAQAQVSSESTRAIAEPKFKPTESLKKLFREVAKRIHPDLAINDADRSRRQKVMASPESVEGEGVGPELIRVIRKIAQIQRRLVTIEAEMQQLRTSDLYQLWSKTDEAQNQGRDLLSEMASQAEQEIAAARKRLAAIVE